MSRFHLKTEQYDFQNQLTHYLKPVIDQGYVAGNLSGLLNGELDDAAWKDFLSAWQDLVPDQYMGDGGHYRQRRYSVFNLEAGMDTVKINSDQRHYQAVDYNPLNGGIYREYPPFSKDFLSNPLFLSVLGFARMLVQKAAPGRHDWRVEGHQFRILATHDESGKPTPEGIHKDGTDFVFILMVNRDSVRGGVSKIYSEQGKVLMQTKLRRPLDFMLVNDRRLLHYVTSIKPLNEQAEGHRDVLVLTFRATD